MANSELTYDQAIKISLSAEWKVSTCDEGEKCWCRVIQPTMKIQDVDGNEIYIAHSGTLFKEHAEHIVEIHNNYLIEKMKSQCTSP